MCCVTPERYFAVQAHQAQQVALPEEAISHGSWVSAVASYWRPETTAATPNGEPASTIRKIRVRPSLPQMEKLHLAPA